MKRFSQVGEKQDVEQYILHTCININVFIYVKSLWKDRQEAGKITSTEQNWVNWKPRGEGDIM